MSPALMKKYLAAARHVADHCVLSPVASSSPHPVVAETDRDKYCVYRIIDFYNRHKVDYADYFGGMAVSASAESVAHVPGRVRRRKRLPGAGIWTTIWSIVSDPEPQAGPLERSARLVEETAV